VGPNYLPLDPSLGKPKKSLDQAMRLLKNPNVRLRFDYAASFVEYPKSQSAVLTLPKIFDSVNSGCATMCNALAFAKLPP